MGFSEDLLYSLLARDDIHVHEDKSRLDRNTTKMNLSVPFRISFDKILNFGCSQINSRDIGKKVRGTPKHHRVGGP